MTLVRTLGGLLSPAGPRAKLSTLIFHRVLPRADPLFPGEVTDADFDRLMSWLKSSFNVLPLGEAIDRLQRGDLPARAAAVTFDDGYADNATVALPILLRHRVHATFFIASAFLDGGRMWNDTAIESIRAARGPQLDLRELSLGVHRIDSDIERRHAIDQILSDIKYLPLHDRQSVVDRLAESCGARPADDLMLRSDQLRALRAAGMAIGGHTATHPILARLDDAQAMSEITEGKRQLESIIGETVDLLAYPNGKPGRDYLMRHAQMARAAGFRAAVSTSAGAADAGSDLFQLPRFTPWDRTPLRFGLRLVDNMRARARIAS